MGDAITGTATRNLTQNILPTMRRGAVATGGWGNSGQGIAQGLATEGTQRGITDSLANMYGSAYEGDQNRSNAMGIANLNASTQRDIASMQDATNRYGLGNSFALGMGNLGLGWGNLGQQQRQGDQSYAIGLGGLGNQAYANETSRAGTMGGLENQRLGLNQTYDLGLGGLENQRYGMDLNYDIGLGGLANNAQSNQMGFYSQQRAQDLQAQQQAQNQYYQSLLGQLGLGQGQVNIGQQQYNAGLNPLQAYGSGLSPFTGLNGSDSTTGPSTGGGIAGAIGGGLTAAQLLARLFPGG